MADPHAARRIAELYLRLFNEHDLSVLPEVAWPDFRSHLRVGDVEGLDAFAHLMREFYVAFPDAVWTVDEWLVDGDRVVLRYHWEATHREAWLGIPPTHRRVRAEGLELLHVRDGKLAEVWNYSDIMGLAAQLHAPAPLSLTM